MCLEIHRTVAGLDDLTLADLRANERALTFWLFWHVADATGNPVAWKEKEKEKKKKEERDGMR